jgi:hypothetical protein
MTVMGGVTTSRPQWFLLVEHSPAHRNCNQPALDSRNRYQQASKTDQHMPLHMPKSHATKISYITAEI